MEKINRLKSELIAEVLKEFEQGNFKVSSMGSSTVYEVGDAFSINPISSGSIIISFAELLSSSVDTIRMIDNARKSAILNELDILHQKKVQLEEELYKL